MMEDMVTDKLQGMAEISTFNRLLKTCGIVDIEVKRLAQSTRTGGLHQINQKIDY